MTRFRVSFGWLSMVVTFCVIALFVVLLVCSAEDKDKFKIITLLFLALLCISNFYCPSALVIAPEALVIKRLMGRKIIDNKSIMSIERCFLTPGGIRLCGSCGFMGFWGYFNDLTIGSYFGYIGNKSKCALIELKDGRRYVVSCADVDDFISQLNGKICMKE